MTATPSARPVTALRVRVHTAPWFTFTLPTGEVVKVDEADRALVEAGCWCRSGGYRDPRRSAAAKPHRIYAAGLVASRWGRRNVRLHRVIMGVVDDPSVQVDHINGDGLDNRRSNLRVCHGRDNRGNTGPQINNTSGRKGVDWHKHRKKWRASILAPSGRSHLGLYETLDAAARAYDRAACALRGEFAHGEPGALNFPDEHAPGCCTAKAVAS